MAAWCDPATPAGQEPFVWVFPAAGGEAKKRAPKKLFREADMYTRKIVIPGVLDARDLHLEAGLSHLEDAFGRTRRDFIDPRKPIPTAPALKLLALVAAQQWRTPSARRHLSKSWGGVLERMDELQASYDRMAPDQKKSFNKGTRYLGGDGPKMDHDQVRRLTEQPLQETLASHVRVLTPLLAKLRMAILCTEASPGFITSDNPCVWFDPMAHKRPLMHQSPALMYRTLEITMPLTPHSMLLLSWRGPTGYADVPSLAVAELNRRTRAYADESFISQSGDADPWWYERGDPSWAGSFNATTGEA